MNNPLSTAAGIIGPPRALIDHIAPLCALLKIPLLTSSWDSKHRECYYPDLSIDWQELSLKYLLQNFNTLIYPIRWEKPFTELIQEARSTYPEEEIFKKNMRLIYSFHGCSDKGYNSSMLDRDEHYNEIDLLLLYGKRMLDLLVDKKCLQAFKKHVLIGNYRYAYYQKHQAFFTSIAEEQIFSKLPKNNKIILYAPSWDDRENSSSFDYAITLLCRSLPREYSLIIKPHPNMLATQCKRKHFYEQVNPYQDRAIFILDDFPLIYPLLAKIDIYLGDFSSVGYDFLTFNRPMFFLNHQNALFNPKGALLHQCGRVIQKEDFSTIYSIMDKSLLEDSFYDIRKKMYHYAYGEELSCDAICSIIKDALT